MILALLGCLARAQPAEAAGAPVIYFVLVDRFANGDPSNDPPGTDPADPQAWHGGDLAGLTQHLDELQDLGVTTLWLSPLMETRYEKFHGWGAFHGYWVEDHGRLDPAYGTEDELRTLRSELEERGMGLVLDMVYNHAAMDGELQRLHPDWFHGLGTIDDWSDPVQLRTHQVHGLPDLDQDDPRVYEHLLSASTYWMELARPSGFRIDAVRHMDPTFMKRLDADLGDVWTLAEIYDGDPVRLQQDWTEGGFEAAFDFPLHFAMIDAFCKGAPSGRLGATLSLDRLYQDPSRLVTFLDNHDRPRLASECPEVDDRHQAWSFLLATRGTPSITWGSELPLVGAEEPHNRGDMRFEPTPERAMLKGLLAMRAGSPALSEGRSWLGGYDPERDSLTVVREGGGDRVSVVITAGRVSLSEGGPDRLQGSVEVDFGEELPEGHVVVGAGPELGHWDPARGVRKATLPRGVVLEYKHVDPRGGQPVWEEGPNRYRWVE